MTDRLQDELSSPLIEPTTRSADSIQVDHSLPDELNLSVANEDFSALNEKMTWKTVDRRSKRIRNRSSCESNSEEVNRPSISQITVSQDAFTAKSVNTNTLN